METKEEFKVKPFGRLRHTPRGSTGSNGYCSLFGKSKSRETQRRNRKDLGGQFEVIPAIWPQKAFDIL
jgi:hypothetical protein